MKGLPKKISNRALLGTISLLISLSILVPKKVFSSSECQTNIECTSTCSSEQLKSNVVSRSNSADTALDYTLLFYNRYHDRDSERLQDSAELLPPFTLSSTSFYESTVKGSNLAQTLLPNQKSSLQVREDGSGDLGALWFGLMAQEGALYQSTLRLRPRRYSFGILNNLHFDLSTCLPGAWIEFNITPTWAKYNLNLDEEDPIICADGGIASSPAKKTRGILPNAQNITEAFNNVMWSFGRLSSERLSTEALDDVPIKIGLDVFKCNHSHLGLYAYALAPFGNIPSGDFLFEPIIGNGGHPGFGGGVNGDLCVYDDTCQTFHFLGDFKYVYLSSAHQRRMVDLCNGGWSRYLQIAREDFPITALPGINYFTRDVRVTPGHQLDLWLAAHFQSHNFHFELGYGMWWRSKETVSMDPTWNDDCENFGVFGFPSVTGTTTTASTASISEGLIPPNNIPKDDTFKTIRQKDFNVSSATLGSVNTHKIIGAMSYDAAFYKTPVNLGLAGFYEFTNSVGRTDRWGITFKLGYSFGNAIETSCLQHISGSTYTSLSSPAYKPRAQTTIVPRKMGPVEMDTLRSKIEQEFYRLEGPKSPSLETARDSAIPLPEFARSTLDYSTTGRPSEKPGWKERLAHAYRGIINSFHKQN